MGARISTVSTSARAPTGARLTHVRTIRMKRTIAALALLALAATTSALAVPSRSIPPSVLLEVRVVEGEFKAALQSDCATDRCFMKGCVYEGHVTLDQPRSSSLPGLPYDEGPGSVAPQDLLTRVRCEFTHEKTVNSADVSKLARRLEARLSRGWLKVTVAPQELEPIPKSLARSSDEEEEKPEETPPEAAPVVEPEPEELTSGLAGRQLWDTLLPHSPWMLGMLLLTLAVLVLIWAGRRLGAPNLEERLMEAQLTRGPADTPASADEQSSAEASEDDAFAAEQEQLWRERLEGLAPDEGDVVARVLREWLKRGEFPMLARALLVFGDRASRAFEGAPELALKKVEFASYFRDVEESALPSRASFFRDLNQQAMASMLLSQDDVDLYRSLREDFGASGLVELMRALPARYAALLYALAEYDQQHEIAALLSAEQRLSVAAQLLSSTRMSLREASYLAACVRAVREGVALPEPPAMSAHKEHGPLLESARALSTLLPHLASADRAALVGHEIEHHGGAVPHWYEDIAFHHMLTELPDELRNDLLLEVDIRGLAGWLQMQPLEWRRVFVAELPEALQNALAQTPAAATKAERVRWAKRGQQDLAAALKGAYARRGIRFVDLVA